MKAAPGAVRTIGQALRFPESGVDTAARKQAGMVIALHDATALQDHDPLCQPEAGQPVSDQDRGAWRFGVEQIL